MYSFAQLTQKLQIIDLLSHKTKKNSKSSKLRSWNQRIFGSIREFAESQLEHMSKPHRKMEEIYDKNTKMQTYWLNKGLKK